MVGAEWLATVLGAWSASECGIAIALVWIGCALRGVLQHLRHWEEDCTLMEYMRTRDQQQHDPHRGTVFTVTRTMRDRSAVGHNYPRDRGHHKLRWERQVAPSTVVLTERQELRLHDLIPTDRLRSRPSLMRVGWTVVVWSVVWNGVTIAMRLLGWELFARVMSVLDERHRDQIALQIRSGAGYRPESTVDRLHAIWEICLEWFATTVGWKREWMASLPFSEASTVGWASVVAAVLVMACCSPILALLYHRFLSAPRALANSIEDSLRIARWDYRKRTQVVPSSIPIATTTTPALHDTTPSDTEEEQEQEGLSLAGISGS